MSSTTTARVGEPFEMPDLQAMKGLLDVLKAQPREWMLIAPDGRTWITEKPEELFAVLAEHHPLLKTEWSKT